MSDQSLFASAVAGVPLRVLEHDKLSSCDGAELLLQGSLSDKRLVCAIHGLWVAAGSLHVEGISRLIGRRKATRRYLALELARALWRYSERLPHRIEAHLRGVLERPRTTSAQASLTMALAARPLVRELDLAWGTLHPARLSYARMRGTQPAAPPESSGFEQHEDDADLDEAGRKILSVFSSPLGGNPLGDMFLKLLGFGRSPASSDDEGAMGGGASSLGSATSSEVGREQMGQASGASTLLPNKPTAFAYPEWDGAGYRPAYAHVHELVPDRHGGLAPERARIGKRALRAQLARVGVEFERARAQPDGAELDLDRVINFAVQRRQGAEARLLYTASQRSKRDLTLLVLLDISASTRDQTQPGQSIFGQQRELAREIVATAQRLGDRAALYAFHSLGRHHVHLLRVKGFAEPFGQRAHQRLDGLEPGGLSRLGAAIRHGTQLLEGETRHSHRVLLTLTDGFAYDDGYERAYAEADTAKALAEAKTRGIACVCLNVGSSQDDLTLARLYGSAAYLRCADPKRAVPKLRRLMRNALLGAGQRKVNV